MAFTVRGLNGTSDGEAQKTVEESLACLKRSVLARTILEDLEEHANVCIDVDPRCEPIYAHPESSYDTVTSGGTAVWNPSTNLQTMNSARLRPEQPWVPQHMCLMNELGHALQYATYPDEFLNIKNDKKLQKHHVLEALEETNLGCVEIPIALELNAMGADETPRWDYQHTGHDRW